MDAGVLLQVLAGGLAQGATLGLVGLGFSLVAGTARVLPFAHGDIALGSIFVAVLLVIGRTPTAAPLATVPSLVLALLTLAVGGLLSAAVAGLLVLPALNRQLLDDRPGASVAFTWIAGGLAAGLLVRALLSFFLPQQAYAVPDALRLDVVLPARLLKLPGGATLEPRVVAVLMIGLVLSLTAQRLLVRSRFGRSLRALADDPVSAALCGISARRVVLGAFAAAGLLAGAAALLSAPGQALSLDNGALLGLDAAAAVVLGGVGSLPGAIAGGLAVGTAQALAGYAFGAGFYDFAPLALLILALAVRPVGAGAPRAGR
jgi:branched-subunit amino acid ABC-type transport system permease component